MSELQASLIIVQQRQIDNLMKQLKDKKDLEEEVKLYRFYFVMEEYWNDDDTALTFCFPHDNGGECCRYVYVYEALRRHINIAPYVSGEYSLKLGSRVFGQGLVLRPLEDHGVVEWDVACRGCKPFITTPKRSLVLLDQLQLGFATILEKYFEKDDADALENYQVFEEFYTHCRNKLLHMK